jgi:nitronate monooxygenase
MTVTTRLTERLGIKHPIISAPMAFAAGGKLAAAVSNAGALGLIGGGYGDGGWIEAEFREAGNTAVGCGFITWRLAERPQLLTQVLRHRPRAVFLSFGDPTPFAGEIKASGSLLICQVQTRADAEVALASGADIVVAQGAEAGGHGQSRATLTLVPEIADLIAARRPNTLLCAAGGIADGRGLAAALMLGADGVVMGTRLWASTEALVRPEIHAAALAASGDDTIRTTVVDIVRRMDWPGRFDIRVVANDYARQWHGKESELKGAIDTEAARYDKALADGDASVAMAVAGEAIGLIRAIEPAAQIIERTVTQAEVLLARAGGLVRHDA